ncbi:hypothetical protein KAS41_03770 [Candidatus Parcubacteria bacterium]|nr:hypothetical protein [Candidatus Parcubacteria bacterium]
MGKNGKAAISCVDCDTHLTDEDPVPKEGGQPTCRWCILSFKDDELENIWFQLKALGM